MWQCSHTSLKGAAPFPLAMVSARRAVNMPWKCISSTVVSILAWHFSGLDSSHSKFKTLTLKRKPRNTLFQNLCYSDWNHKYEHLLHNPPFFPLLLSITLASSNQNYKGQLRFILFYEISRLHNLISNKKGFKVSNQVSYQDTLFSSLTYVSEALLTPSHFFFNNWVLPRRKDIWTKVLEVKQCNSVCVFNT